jgi:hypothetical protein
MPFILNPELTQGSRDRMWSFHVTRTHEGANVDEVSNQLLSHDVVVRIFREVMGAVPATGLELDDIVERDRLEPRLRAEIERLLPDRA